MAHHPKLAPTEALERTLLLSLDFVRDDFKAFHRAHPTAMTVDGIRAAIRREFPSQVAALEARIMAGPAPKAIAAPRAAAAPVSHASHLHAVPSAADVRAAEARAEQQDMIAQKMQSGAYAHDAPRGTSYDPQTGIQRFGIGRAS